MRRLLLALALVLVAQAALPQAAFYWNVFSLDKFSYSNGNLSGQSNWVVANGGAGFVTLSVVSNTIQCSSISATDCGNQFNVTYPNDQCSQVGINTLNSTSAGTFAVTVRSSTGGANYYGLAVKGPLGATASVSLFKVIAGVATVLVASTTETINSGDLIGLCAQGTSLYITLRGTLVAALNHTDSSITSGQPGVVINSNGQAETDIILQNWSGIFLGTTAPVGGGGGGVAAIKWHVGHYAASNTYVEPGNPNKTQIQAEVSIVRSGPPSILGYAPQFFWNTFENSTAGVYDFSTLDQIYVQLLTGSTTWTTGMAMPTLIAPRRMGIYMTNGWFFNSNPTTEIPTYITSSSTYGPLGPDGIHNGYWTSQGSTGLCTGTLTALYRPAVMNRFILLGRAIAAHVLPDGNTVDTSPYIEMVGLLNETAELAPGNGCGTDSSYTTSGAVTQVNAMDVAFGPLGSGAAFPHTNVQLYNNYFQGPDETAALAYTMPALGTAAAGPDTWGISTGANTASCATGLCGITWGQNAYIGNKSPGDCCFNSLWAVGTGTDLRGVVPGMFQVQLTELGYDVVYTPADIFAQMNTTLKATHDIWEIAVPGTFPCSGCAATTQTSGNWFGSCSGQTTWNSNPSACGGVLFELNANPLSTTACPTAYIGGCNTTLNLPAENDDHFRKILDGRSVLDKEAA